jgi:hypothetical protein
VNPSSDIKIGTTKSRFLPDPVAPVNSQTRTVDSSQIATTFGHKASTPNPAKVPGNNRPVKK